MTLYRCSQLRLVLLLSLGTLAGFAVCYCVADVSDATSTVSPPPPTPSIPRSENRPKTALSDPDEPPWKLSPKIDDDGFLKDQYIRVPGEWEEGFQLRGRHINLKSAPAVTIRQVPGDGNCLFHSISTCYAHALNGTHVDLADNHRDQKNVNDLDWLYQHSTKLRHLAVDYLEERRKLLYLHGREYMRAKDLVDSAASQYGITDKEYCELMRKESYWGGGPEIVALCNVLKRPIHVYELHVPELPKLHKKKKKKSRKRQKLSLEDDEKDESPSSLKVEGETSSSASISPPFVLRRMACFGSPKYDRYPPLHILSADSRFPDVNPGEQLESGNHFLAVFPEPISRGMRNEMSEDEIDELRGGRLRGGYDDSTSSRAGRILRTLLRWLNPL